MVFSRRDYSLRKALDVSLRCAKLCAISALLPGTLTAPVFAKDSLATNPPIFVPAYSISDIKLKDFAVAVGYVFAMPREDIYVSANNRLANFIFISQPDAIIDGRIQTNALNIFDEPTRQLLSSLDLDSDVCSALPVGFSNEQTAVLTVHSSNKSAIDIGKRCFLVGLAIFNGGTPDEIKKIQNLGIKPAMLYLLNNFSKLGDNP